MPKIAILVFLYNLDRLTELDYLCYKNTNLYISLIVNIQHKDNTSLILFLNKYKDRIIYYNTHENYGVDISPFLEQMYHLDAMEYPYFIKLHSKNSKIGTYNHVDWGTVLWDSVIGNATSLLQNIHILEQPNIGAITQPLLIFNNQELNNSQKISVLCDYLNIDYNRIKNTRFMAGSIFMSKTQLFKNILDNKYKYIDLLLSTETGKVDDRNYVNGTFCHAMERIFGYLITYQKYKIHGSSLYPILKIYNPKYKALKLHTMYDNTVYIVQDFNIYGHILTDNDKNIDIVWHHLKNTLSKYKYITDKIITRTG